MAAVGTALLLLSGCSAIGPDRTGAERAAADFYAALRAGSDAKACRLLAPRTVEELEDQTGTRCSASVGRQQLPPAHGPTDVEVYGNNGKVVLTGDVVFVSQFGNQWKVVAAGCEPRTGRPYSCTVKGG